MQSAGPHPQAPLPPPQARGSSAGEPWTFDGDRSKDAARIDATLAGLTLRPERFEGQFQRFYDALQKGDELPVTLADARIARAADGHVHLCADRAGGRAAARPSAPRLRRRLPEEAR
ncbi:MAG TPA: hypothetical protein VKE41_10385 [Roseiflexaceae bacterium]|nr:hypothetical protein [Roseiflexaceae bacterium]